MNGPTIIVCLILAAVVAAIVGRGIYNRRHHKGGCGCGCESCANHDICHPKETES